jgi:hypothetical protein
MGLLTYDGGVGLRCHWRRLRPCRFHRRFHRQLGSWGSPVRLQRSDDRLLLDGVVILLILCLRILQIEYLYYPTFRAFGFEYLSKTGCGACAAAHNSWTSEQLA